MRIGVAVGVVVGLVAAIGATVWWYASGGGAAMPAWEAALPSTTADARGPMYVSARLYENKEGHGNARGLIDEVHLYDVALEAKGGGGHCI